MPAERAASALLRGRIYALRQGGDEQRLMLLEEEARRRRLAEGMGPEIEPWQNLKNAQKEEK